MATTLYRIIRNGFQNFFRQQLTTVATLVIMLLALLVFESLIIFNFVSRTALEFVQDKIDISVYFKSTAPEDEILRIKRSLETLAEVKSASYISRDKALENFKVRHKDDEKIGQAITEVGDNPLLASLEIKANDPKQYPTIDLYLKSDSLKQFIDKTTYNQNQVVIDKLTSFIDWSWYIGSALTVFLAMVAVLIVFNTILLAIYSNKEEIEIMRLVGASNMFIRGPYIVEGIIYGVIAAVLSIIIIAPVIYYISPYLQGFIYGLNLAGYFTSHIFVIFGYLLLFGIGIGVISSLIAIRKYLKV
jgi:cell division transport system permease protein